MKKQAKSNSKIEKIGNDLKAQVQQALKAFGEYSYMDKGPSEVMDMDKILKRLNSLPAAEVREVVLWLREHDSREFLAMLSDEILICMDGSIPEERLAEICGDDITY